MQLTRRPRTAALEPFVDLLSYSEAEGPASIERVLPSGGSAVMFNLVGDTLYACDRRGTPTITAGGAAFCGPSATSRFIDTANLRSIVSIAFKPGGAAPFVTPPISETTADLVDLTELWGPSAVAYRERLIEKRAARERLDLVERLLLDHIVRPLQADPALTSALAALRNGYPIARIGEQLELSPKRLIRLFNDRIGLPPKRLARLTRFQRVLHQVAPEPDVDWARVAVEHGFSDQSHLINDFRELAGITPTAYRPISLEAHNHVAVDSAETGKFPPIPSADEWAGLST